jgi:hypothetical protein
MEKDVGDQIMNELQKQVLKAGLGVNETDKGWHLT